MESFLKVKLFGSNHNFGDNQRDWQKPTVVVILQKQLSTSLGSHTRVDGFKIVDRELLSQQDIEIGWLCPDYDMFPYDSFHGTYMHEAQGYRKTAKPYLDNGFEVGKASVDDINLSSVEFEQLLDNPPTHESCTAKTKWQQFWHGPCASCLF